MRQWAHGRAFWLDELLLQRAMSQQRMSELLAPLGFAQSAPPGWLAVQHAVLGALRQRRARRPGCCRCCAASARWCSPCCSPGPLLSGPAALLATAVVALSPPLIGYSVEFKQYSSDVFCVLLVAAPRHPARARPWPAGPGSARAGRRRARCVWFSHAGALVTVGVLAALGAARAGPPGGGELRAAVACAVPAATGLAVEYAVLLRRNADRRHPAGLLGQRLPAGTADLAGAR